MWTKFTAHENPWVAADNAERLKTAATILGYFAAVAAGLICLAVGLIQA